MTRFNFKTAFLPCIGVALLPFVDEKRLLKALEAVYPDLEEAEGKSQLNRLSVLRGDLIL